MSKFAMFLDEILWMYTSHPVLLFNSPTEQMMKEIKVTKNPAVGSRTSIV